MNVTIGTEGKVWLLKRTNGAKPKFRQLNVEHGGEDTAEWMWSLEHMGLSRATEEISEYWNSEGEVMWLWQHCANGGNKGSSFLYLLSPKATIGMSAWVPFFWLGSDLGGFQHCSAFLIHFLKFVTTTNNWENHHGERWHQRSSVASAAWRNIDVLIKLVRFFVCKKEKSPSANALTKTSANGCQYSKEPRGDGHLLSSKQFCQKWFICVKSDYLNIRRQRNGSRARVRSSLRVSKPIFKHGGSVHTENPNEVILANSFIIQANLFLWIRTEVCIFINDPGGFRRSWKVFCASPRAGGEHLFQKRGHCFQMARCGKCDGPREMAWIAMTCSKEETNPYKKAPLNSPRGCFLCMRPPNK